MSPRGGSTADQRTHNPRTLVRLQAPQTDQREVSGNERSDFFPASRTLALLLSCALAATPGLARAQDGGLPDAPLARRLDCGLCLNAPAEKALDDEVKRLQGVEREHKAESWLGVVLVSVLVGLTLGGATVGVIWYATTPRK